MLPVRLLPPEVLVGASDGDVAFQLGRYGLAGQILYTGRCILCYRAWKHEANKLGVVGNVGDLGGCAAGEVDSVDGTVASRVDCGPVEGVGGLVDVTALIIICPALFLQYQSGEANHGLGTCAGIHFIEVAVERNAVEPVGAGYAHCDHLMCRFAYYILRQGFIIGLGIIKPGETGIEKLSVGQPVVALCAGLGHKYG